MFQTGTASGYEDLLDKLNTFLTAKGSAFGLTYSGVGDGTFTDYSGGASSVAETFTITATSASSFDVVGSVTGSIGPATVGTPFSHGTIEFTLTAGSTAFQAGDVFTISTAPKWTSRRRARGCEVLGSHTNDGIYGAQNVVDGKVDQVTNTFGWYIDSDQATNSEWLELQFFESETFEDWSLQVHNTGFPDTAKLEYWNGSSWVELDNRTGLSWAAYEVKRWTIASPVAADLYRVTISHATNDVGGVNFVELFRDSADQWPASYASHIWEAPGNDGAREILVGVHPFMRPDVDYHNWEIQGFDAWNAAVRTNQQAGYEAQIFMPLWDGSIGYWFVADGQRVVVVAKIGTQYESCYLGLIDPYFSPDQHPYPMGLGGSLAMDYEGGTIHWNNTAFRYSNVGDQHAAFCQADPDTGILPRPRTNHAMRVRRTDGFYQGFYARLGGTPQSTPTDDSHTIWPYVARFDLLDVNLDGSRALWPIMFTEGSPNTWGQLAGVFAITGQGLSAEDLVRLGQIDYLAVPNVNRTTRTDFWVLGLD